MIKKLSIRNYTLIDELNIEFNSGFSVITGETGAGKSIILGALSLILGQRADLKSLKRTDEKSVIEGLFDISSYHLQSFFEENELDYDAKECILRREILPSGKSRAFINDTPVSVTQLKSLGEQLIDIHSQHQNLLLADSHFQLRVVDTMAGNFSLLSDYQREYRSWHELLREYARLQDENRLGREEEDYLRYQLSQLEAAQLKEGEQEELEVEQQTLQHAEEIKGELAVIQGYLHEEETGVVPLLNAALSKMKSLSRLYPEIDELVGRIESDYIDLKDIASSVDHSQDSLSVDPDRLSWVENRLDIYYSLQQKHRVSTAVELLALRDSFADKLTRIENFDEELSELRRKIEVRERRVSELVGKLSAERRKAADQISTSSKTIEGNAIAHAMALPSIVFDEVDTGVSGEIADKMAGIMREMAECMQVISITHLPQVASLGQTHYRVYKSDTETSTATHLIKLSEKERIEEIARMLSGSSLTAAALDNACELLKRNDLKDGKK